MRAFAWMLLLLMGGCAWGAGRVHMGRLTHARLFRSGPAGVEFHTSCHVSDVGSDMCSTSSGGTHVRCSCGAAPTSYQTADIERDAADARFGLTTSLWMGVGRATDGDVEVSTRPTRIDLDAGYFRILPRLGIGAGIGWQRVDLGTLAYNGTVQKLDYNVHLGTGYGPLSLDAATGYVEDGGVRLMGTVGYAISVAPRRWWSQLVPQIAVEWQRHDQGAGEVTRTAVFGRLLVAAPGMF